MATLQQREELHRTIWSMADELRGAVGGWDFKATHSRLLKHNWQIVRNYMSNIGINN